MHKNVFCPENLHRISRLLEYTVCDTFILTDLIHHAWTSSQTQHRMIKDELFLFVCGEIRGKNEIHSNLESHFCAISIPAEKPEMAKGNESLTTEFILKGLTDHPVLKTLLFLVFLTIYLITMVGNLGLVALILWNVIHTSMYIFLGNLA